MCLTPRIAVLFWRQVCVNGRHLVLFISVARALSLFLSLKLMEAISRTCRKPIFFPSPPLTIISPTGCATAAEAGPQDDRQGEGAIRQSRCQDPHHQVQALTYVCRIFCHSGIVSGQLRDPRHLGVFVGRMSVILPLLMPC